YHFKALRDTQRGVRDLEVLRDGQRVTIAVPPGMLESSSVSFARDAQASADGHATSWSSLGKVGAHGVTWPGARLWAISTEWAQARSSLPTCGTACRLKPEPWSWHCGQRRPSCGLGSARSNSRSMNCNSS